MGHIEQINQFPVASELVIDGGLLDEMRIQSKAARDSRRREEIEMAKYNASICYAPASHGHERGHDDSVRHGKGKDVSMALHKP